MSIQVNHLSTKSHKCFGVSNKMEKGSITQVLDSQTKKGLYERWNLDVTLAMIDPVKKRQIEINIEEDQRCLLGGRLDAKLVFPVNTNTSKKFYDCIKKFIEDNPQEFK